MRLAVGLAMALALAACERTPEPPPPPTEAPAARNERAGPVRWNPDARAFELSGKPLRAVKLWTFEGSTEGCTSPRSQVIPADPTGLRVTFGEPSLRSPRGLAVDGSHYSLVLVRLTRLKGGGGWNGALYYSTPQHGEAGGLFGKPVLGADPAPGETAILVYDMANQTVGGEDWKTSLIDQIRFDLQDQPGGEFLIHQIAIAARADLAGPKPNP